VFLTQHPPRLAGERLWRSASFGSEIKRQLLSEKLKEIKGQE
jgi:hypothetical protein